MRPTEFEHLVIGAGLLGLAAADHLLRRGARGVQVFEARGAPNAGRPGEPGAVLRSGHPELHTLEERGRTFLEGAADWIGVEPPFRRAGSMRLPADDPLPAGTERLDAVEIEARFPGLVAEADAARFVPSDGTLETLPVIAALHARLRAQGGRLVVDAEVRELREEGDAVHFVAAGRSGRARRVILAAGADSLALLPALGARHRWRREVVHTFLLEGGRDAGAALWIPEARATLAPRGEGEWDLEIAADDDDGGSDPPVDWTLLERFRAAHAERIPWLAGTRVRRGRAQPRLAFAPGEVVLASRLGRIAAAGAFGPHGLALHAAVGEILAERALADPEESGGILEEG